MPRAISGVSAARNWRHTLVRGQRGRTDRSRWSLCASLLIVACGLVFSGCELWTEADRAQMEACLLSVSGAFLEHRPAAGINLESKRSWVRLSDDEAVALLGAIAQTGSVTECGRWRGTEPLIDPWGNRVLADAWDEGNGWIQLRVWSKGSDGREGTSDDLSAGGSGPVEPIVAPPRP